MQTCDHFAGSANIAITYYFYLVCNVNLINSLVKAALDIRKIFIHNLNFPYRKNVKNSLVA